MNKLEYTTIKEQIQKLKNDNLIIENESDAETALELFGYSNLIKGYRNQYTITIDNEKKFNSNASFNQIMSLFTMDKCLRNATISATLDFEEFVKSSFSDVLASSFGIHQNDYLKYCNFRDKRKKNQFSLKSILEHYAKAIEKRKGLIPHYLDKYSCFPPWILLKNIYMSDQFNLINFLKPKEKILLMHHIYDYDHLKETYNLSEKQAVKLMVDTLFVCLGYRNASAHGNRIFDYKCPAKVRCDEIFNEPNVVPDNGFSQLLSLFGFIKYQTPYLTLHDTLESQVTRHLRIYPQDITYLSKILNVGLVKKEIVFVSENSKKYHSIEHCSGLKFGKEVELNDAISSGYNPCSKCIIS